MNKIKTIAFYLPQYHEIEENNKWWGKGFTEWVNVKKAKPLFSNHEQPNTPLDNNYYDLTDVNVMRWQSKIAKEYGVDGFCFYHYWFNDKPIMNKPIENFLAEKDIDMTYCLCWANESWTNRWAAKNAATILKQTYGEEKEWKIHFEYLLKFFKDHRYLKEDGKPVVIIYKPALFNGITKMMDYWKKLAIDNGFTGLVFMSQKLDYVKNENIYSYMDYHIEYQPNLDEYANKVKLISLTKRIKALIKSFFLDLFNLDISNKNNKGPTKLDYNIMWNIILNNKPISNKQIAGGFVNWDNTPRYGRQGSVFTGVTPEKFQNYMLQQYKHIEKEYNKQYLFLFAWNEWGETGYLEPDTRNGYAYLKALKEAKKQQTTDQQV